MLQYISFQLFYLFLYPCGFTVACFLKFVACVVSLIFQNGVCVNHSCEQASDWMRKLENVNWIKGFLPADGLTAAVCDVDHMLYKWCIKKPRESSLKSTRCLSYRFRSTFIKIKLIEAEVCLQSYSKLELIYETLSVLATNIFAQELNIALCPLNGPWTFFFYFSI
jgi:hypothetical protein